MHCEDCAYKNSCRGHKEDIMLVGCTSGKPVEMMTNADKIRGMNDIQLSEFIRSIGDGDSLCRYMGKEFHNSCANPDLDMCAICVREWLESEVSE